MRKKFSKSWNSSKKPRKQRKYLLNAPLHIRKKFVSSTLSKELRKQYGTRNIPVKTGDKVRVLRGQYKKKEGKINQVNKKSVRVYVEGIEVVKKDGNKVFFPIHPSNLMIIDLNLEDKMRKKIIQRKVKKEKENVKEAEKK